MTAAGADGLLVVTDRHQARAPLPEVVAAAVTGGARWVLLRDKDLPAAQRAVLADRLRQVLAPVGGRLIVAGPDPLGGEAVHLPADRSVEAPAGMAIVGRSCHDADDLGRLAAERYVTVSPVFATTSKPGYGPPLGLTGLAGLCRLTDRPVLALGGVESPQRAADCVAAGAAGVAVMGPVMRADDPAAVVAQLCQALSRRSAAYWGELISNQ